MEVVHSVDVIVTRECVVHTMVDTSREKVWRYALTGGVMRRFGDYEYGDTGCISSCTHEDENT